MKKYLLSIALISIMSLEINAHVDHYSKYNYLEYELFRNNKSIGYHKYNFKRTGSNLIIDNEVEFKITKLGIDLYKYYAKGVERYENGVFSGFNSETNQNKKEKYVNITIDPTDKDLIIDGSSFKGKVDKDTIIGTNEILGPISKFVKKLSTEVPVLYGLFSIVLALLLGVGAAIFRKFFSEFKKKYTTNLELKS